ncbi:DeoR/GlpR family DNA-binding transcription regulator [Euzebya sp.]|uniref:DeoR/GlpR family DNA-binding transcription regulator n=1 Tax=Euzebya sp. TaxID=1971409 RepID=UPI003518E580
MFAEERRNAIADLVREHGRVDSGDLSVRYDVNPETVRRDLQVLQDRGLIHRVYGGAVATDRLMREVAVANRGTLMRAEKERIATVAVGLVRDGDAIFIDAGSTTALFAEGLPTTGHLTIFTNALPIAMHLSDHTDHTVQTVGGRVRGTTYAEVDGWALERLASLRVDTSFVGTNGIDPSWGLSTPDPSEGAVKRAMLAAATQNVLLADHSKVGVSHACRYAELDAIDVLVTDEGIDARALSSIRDRGLEVLLA